LTAKTIVAECPSQKAAQSRSDVRPLFRMPLQVPAGHVSAPGKQRIGASLRLRRIEEEFCLPIFLRNGVVGRDRDLSEGLAVRGDAIAERNVVRSVCQQRQAQRGGQSDDNHALQEMLDSGSPCGTHDRQL
jgi:hypothetical protein